MKYFVSLSSKTALFASIMVCVATSIIAALVFYSSKTFFLESSVKSLNSEAILLTIEVENSFERVAKDLFFLSDTPPIQGIIRSYNNHGIDAEDASTLKLWKRRLSVIFRSILEVNSDYIQLRYIGVAEGGKEIVRLDRGGYKIFETSEDCLQKNLIAHISSKAFRQRKVVLYSLRCRTTERAVNYNILLFLRFES